MRSETMPQQTDEKLQKNVNVEQIRELIRRNYRVPRYFEVDIDSDPSLMPEYISLRDVLEPVLIDYLKAKKREAYLIEVVKYFLSPGCLYSYRDNATKQNIINEIAEVIPDVKWLVGRWTNK